MNIFVISDLRFPYLLIYNVAMFLGYLILFIELMQGYTKDGDGNENEGHSTDSILSFRFSISGYFAMAYKSVGPKMICCQLAQFFEIAHSLLGYVKSGWIAPTLQVGDCWYHVLIS